MADDYVIVLATFPAAGQPLQLARTLVDERLAACVNILPGVTSIYRWTAGVEQDEEYQIIMKTTRVQLPALWERVRQLHPYDVPEFIVLPILEGNPAYLRWIGESVGAG